MDTMREAPEIFPVYEQLLDARNIPATDVSTTMIYLHVMKRPGSGGPSPLDLS